MSNILIDLERLKYPNTGLHTFCSNLGSTLLKRKSQAQDLTFYVPAKDEYIFGHNPKYFIQKTWHKLLKPDFKQFDICHTTNQVSRYIPSSNKPKLVLTIHDLNFLIEKKDQGDKITIGEVLKKKNFHVLIDMMELMPEYDLYICGNYSGDYGQFIKRRSEKLDNVFVTGVVDNSEKAWLYKNCEAFFFPSICEGFGLPIIEALQFGKHVVASTSTCLPEIGGDHVSYWDDFNPEAMKEVVVNGIKEHNKEKSLKAIEYSSKFNYQKNVDEYLDLYRKTMALT